jgi:hypothetical protein
VAIGRWSDDTALVRTGDGRTAELPVPEELRAGFDVGSELHLHPTEDRILAVAALDPR